MAHEHSSTEARGYLGTLLPIDWNRVRGATNEPVPGHIKRWWFALGGTPAYLFFIQLTTGILLTFYYEPSAERAYESVDAITHAIPYGWFVRSIHKWAANLMIVTVLLHMCRVYFSCAFRHPRQLNWVVGCCLLGCTLVMGFTGYSLVYEQLSYWGITVATQLTETAPFVGHALANFMRGGEVVGPNTLTRMFVLHVGILPVAMIGLIALHVTILRLHGVSELSFIDNAAIGRRTGRAVASQLIGVRLVALLVALLAVGSLYMAMRSPMSVHLIALDLSPESSRIFWMIAGGLLATTAVLLYRGHLHGLFLWLFIALLAIGKFVFDIANHEAAGRSTLDPTGAGGVQTLQTIWVAAALILAISVGYCIFRHDRFIEDGASDKPFNFFPDHIVGELMVGTLLLFLLTLLSLVFPAHLGEKANPLVTPAHIKPEWYFFFQFRLLKIVGLETAVLLTGALAGLLVAWPWFDALLERMAPQRDLGVYIGVVSFITFLAFTIWESVV